MTTYTKLTPQNKNNTACNPIYVALGACIVLLLLVLAQTDSSIQRSASLSYQVPKSAFSEIAQYTNSLNSNYEHKNVVNEEKSEEISLTTKNILEPILTTQKQTKPETTTALKPIYPVPRQDAADWLPYYLTSHKTKEKPGGAQGEKPNYSWIFDDTEEIESFAEPWLVRNPWDISQINCKRPTCHETAKITYYIHSHYSKGFNRRQLVRSTWGKNQSIVFVTFSKGNFVAPVDAGEGDMMICSDFIESEDLTTVKTLMIIYTASLCGNHAMKTDDDVQVFPENLEKNILKNWSDDKIVEMRGCCWCCGQPLRSGRYQVTIMRYPWKKYPRYCSGAGFIMSHQATIKLAEKIPITRVIPHIEDMSVGMLAHDAKIEMKLDRNFDCDMTYKETKKIQCGVVNLHRYTLNDEALESLKSKCLGKETSDKIDLEGVGVSKIGV